ncbi:hypothetical protein QRD89_11840 [Halobacillus sp. ACCC02827]|uniref:hypothetical protein n=1 Tax=Bacillaceae TaxID=186817 RepID=UPI0002A50140|nr:MULTISPECIES: hypothetical protein [Bacillaceae]ELK45467.1 hypothetical protein D479_14462 [Halobacillus sp. BAB-2008]QHT47179.1 hypothetical protein M662_11995 [Bacillus sp. SB49]WJE14410.1 hypothetical protein QRD89_11840 [Halobacillus sp. ACCC02827]
MYDPKKPVENQETEKAPRHGDELEQVHNGDEPTTDEVLNEAFAEMQEQDFRQEAGYRERAEDVDDHGRGPDQPVYGDSYEEEFAQEAAIGRIDEPMNHREQETTMEEREDVKVGMGWIGLTAAILSFFFAPIILGVTGIIFGAIGKRRGADTLGNMAIIISIVSIAFSLFFAPFFNLI